MGEVEPQEPVSPANEGHLGREWVPIILAIGLAFAINAITIAVLIDALRSIGPGISENATQILTTAFGGIIGVLGSAMGYRQANVTRDNADAAAAQRAGEQPHD